MYDKHIFRRLKIGLRAWSAWVGMFACIICGYDILYPRDNEALASVVFRLVFVLGICKAFDIAANAVDDYMAHCERDSN